MNRRAPFARRFRKKSVWLVACNFTVDSPGTADRQGFLFNAPLASGTRTAIPATVLSSVGIRAAVGGESGKTRRIVGDVVVSSVIDQGNAIGDLYVREAIVYVQIDSTGSFLATEVDLFSSFVLGSENILAYRQTYIGPADTVGGVARPNIRNQWFQDGGFSRWDIKVTRRLDDDHVLIYVTCIKPIVPLVAPSVIMAGELRQLVVR